MLIVWIIPCPPIRRPLTRIHLIYPTIYVYMPIRSPLLTILALSPEKFGHLENVIQKLATIHRDKLTCWWSDSTHLSWLKQTILIYRSIDLWIYESMNLWQSMTIYDNLWWSMSTQAIWTPAVYPWAAPHLCTALPSHSTWHSPSGAPHAVPPHSWAPTSPA
jgi:hypothetical protein